MTTTPGNPGNLLEFEMAPGNTGNLLDFNSCSWKIVISNVIFVHREHFIIQ